MPKKKKVLLAPRKYHRQKKTNKQSRGRPSQNPCTVTNSLTLQNQYNDLKSKFKLKEIRIILRDIVADNTILQPQELCSDKKKSKKKAIDKCKNYTTKRIYKKKKKSSVKNVVNTGCATTSSAIEVGKDDTDKKIIETDNIDNDSSNIQTKPLDIKEQETSFHKHVKFLSISDSNDNKNEKKKCIVKNDIECILKPENTNLSICASNSNQNPCFDLLNKASVSDVQCTNENEEEKQNINSNHQNEEVGITNKDFIENKDSIVQIDQKSPNNAQEILIQKEDTSKIYNQNSFKGRDLPKITEDKILGKNTILFKPLNNVEIANNLQDTTSYTNVVSQNNSNECPLIEKYCKVADLTEDNLYKFTENSNRNLALQDRVADNLRSCANSSSTEIILQTNKDDLHVPYRKRGWIAQKTSAEPNKSSTKRVKLNRKCIQEKCCTTRNSSSICLSGNKNSNLFSKCISINTNNDKVKDMDDRLTLYSNNGNSLCTMQIVSELAKADFDNILKSTYVVEENICSGLHTELNGENEKNQLLITENCHKNAKNIVENQSHDQVKNKINDNCDIDRKGADNNDTDHTNDECKNRKNNYDNDNCKDNDDGVDDDDDDDDDDCISLFTDSLLSVDSIVAPAKENEKKHANFHDYKMTGTIFNKYLQQNILEFNKQFDTIEEQDTLKNKTYKKSDQAKQEEEIEQNSTPALEKLAINVENISSVNSHVINNNISSCPDKNYDGCDENIDCYDAMTFTKQMELITCQGLCRGYCFAYLRHGECNKIQCYFNHNLQPLIRNIILKYKQYLISIIHYLYSMKYHYFLRKLYHESLQMFDVACIIDLYEKLYSMQSASSDVVCITVNTLLNKGMHPKDVVDSLCKILISTDNWTPQHILNSIKGNINVGEHWDTLNSLFTYFKPPRDIIESILNDCLITREHIQEVHINLIKRLHAADVNQLNRDLMLSFNDLLKHECQKIPDNVSPEAVNNEKESSNESYVLHSITDLPETNSQYRDRFWKLYLMIYNIKEALVHEDYDYIISILNEYEEIDENEKLFSRCCFHMLTAEIKHSEYHISKIIEHAVQIGASSILYKVLLDVATYILMKLIIENAWTLAYKLMKTIQIYNLQHSAAFIILSAEIYLANKHAIKALMLIKQSNIISTNRDNWNVRSNAQDYYPRTNIIGILLDVLCIKSPEHAFFIFQFLTKDQGNNFRPIDLTHYVDKLMLKLLIEREIDLIVKMGYMIIEYNFTFFNITICRAVIASVVHIDMVLAKQLYQYASGLGIYRTIELSPVIHVIINVDWVEEEIYLTFWCLFQRLVMDIGHGIDHLNSAELSIYIIFEVVPTEAHLYCESLDEQQMKKIQISKNLVRQVLRSRFEPPLLLTKKKINGTIMKLQNKTVIHHLKSIYKNYIE